MSEIQVIDISKEMSITDGVFHNTTFRITNNDNIGIIEMKSVEDGSGFYSSGYWESGIISIKGGTVQVKTDFTRNDSVNIFYKYTTDESWSEYQLLEEDGVIAIENIKMLRFKIELNSTGGKNQDSDFNYGYFSNFQKSYDINDTLEKSKHTDILLRRCIPTSSRGIVENNFEIIQFKKISENENGGVFSAKIKKSDYARIEGVF